MRPSCQQGYVHVDGPLLVLLVAFSRCVALATAISYVQCVANFFEFEFTIE